MKNNFLLIVLLTLCSGISTAVSQIQIKDFDDVKLFELANRHGMRVGITNYGAIITSIVVPDRNGNLVDVALGYQRLEQYVNAIDRPYFGAVAGRFANRIANGSFTIDGLEYSLATNNGPHHLHGGNVGFDKVIWDAETKAAADRNGVVLSYLSKDGEEGYPGNLEVEVSYFLTDENEIQIKFLATTDKPTHVNLTQHTYFNLKGEGNGDVLDHEMMIHADRFTPVDQTLIPTGELADVSGTPFDFRRAKSIGKDIDVDHHQLKFGLGYDHNWVINGNPGEMRKAASVYEPESGRTLDVLTQEPGMQFYTGNFLDGRLRGKSGAPYVHRGGFCLETQHFPNSPNQKEFPSTLLLPDEKYQTKTTFRFGVRR